MSIVLIDDEGALVIWQGGALEVWGPPDLEPHEPWALWLVAVGTQGATRRLMRGSEADIKRLLGVCTVWMLLANSEIAGIVPHTILLKPSEIRIPPLSKP